MATKIKPVPGSKMDKLVKHLKAIQGVTALIPIGGLRMDPKLNEIFDELNERFNVIAAECQMTEADALKLAASYIDDAVA